MKRRWQLLALLIACLFGIGFGVLGLGMWPHATGNAVAGSGQSKPDLVAWTSGDIGTGKSTSTDVLIHRYQQTAKHYPNEASAWVQLATAYMQKERETTDVTYYQLTDDAASRALQLAPNDVDALAIRTWVMLGRHDFAGAATLAKQTIKQDAFNVENYANLGDAEANLGNYAAMDAAYQKMVDLKPGLASYNRASYARWLYGDIRGAAAYMLLATNAGSTVPENVAWCQTQLGDDYFNAGFILGARQAYMKALKSFPHYARALAGLAAVDAALGHPQAAIHEYRQAIAVVPLPQFLASLGDLYVSLGNQSAAERQYKVIAFIDHLYLINHVRIGIDEAQFFADHNRNLKEALQLAKADSQVRHDVTTMDTLAWTLYRNGQYGAAWTAERQALRLGTKFAPFYYHAGLIQARLGNIPEAQHYLQTALMINPHFSPLFAPEAQRELVKMNGMAAGSSAGSNGR